MNRKFWVTASLLILLGLTVGFAVHFVGQPGRSAFADGAVILEPVEYELPQPILEYGEATAPLTLRNGSTGPLLVTSVESNCGCIEALGSDGEPLTFPIEVAADTTLPLSCRITPRRLFGKYRLTVLVNCKGDGGTTFSRSADLIVDIRSGPRAFPNRVVLPDAEPETRVQTVIDLFDAYPGEGIGIAELKSSDPQRLRVEQVGDFKPNHPPEHDDFGVNPRADFRHRHRLRLSFRSGSQGAQWFRGAVTVVPDSPGMPKLTIAVSVRTRAPRYQLSPKQLTLVLPEDVNSVQRRLKCRIREGEASELVVLESPDFADVTIATEAPRIKVIDVNFRIPARAEPKGDIVLSLSGRSEGRLTIPVRVIRLSQPE